MCFAYNQFGARRQINRDGGTELVIDVRFCGFGGVHAGSRHMDPSPNLQKHERPHFILSVSGHLLVVVLYFYAHHVRICGTHRSFLLVYWHTV
jgi:hypothetical protein